MSIMKYTTEQAQVLNAVHNNFAANERQLAAKQSAQIMLAGNAISSLPRDFFGQWASDAVEIQRQELTVLNRLNNISRGVDIGVFVDHFMVSSDSGSVNRSIDGKSQAKKDQAVFDYHGVPIGINDSVAAFGWRQMKAAQNRGFNLSEISIANNQRKVAESLEHDALYGSGISFDGARSYGLLTHPQRNRIAHGVDVQKLDGKGAKELGIKIMNTMHAANFRGAAMEVFLNYDDWYYLSTTDYSAQYPNKSALDGLKEAMPYDTVITGSSSLEANELAGIVKRRDVFEVLSAMPLSTIPKVRHDATDDYEFQVMAAQALQLKFDYNGNAGYFHAKKTMPTDTIESGYNAKKSAK